MLPDQRYLVDDRERHLALALEAARMVAWTWDAVHDVVETVGNVADIYGVSEVERAERGFGMIHPDDVARHRQAVERAMMTGEPFTSEFRVIRPDNGNTIWLEERAVPVLDAAGRPVRLSGVTMDVSARKQTEASLEDAVARREAVFASLDQAIIVLDMPSRTIVAVSPAFERVYGFRPDELTGETTERLHLDHEHFVEFGRLLFSELDARGTAQLEYVMRRKDGTPFYAEVISNEIRNGSGERTGTVSVVRDISSRRQAEAALREARAAAEQAADRVARLQAVTAALAGALTADEVFEVAVREGSAALGAAAGGISLISADGQWLELVHHAGYEGGRVEAYRRLPLSTASAGTDVARTGQALWIESNDEWLALYPQMAQTRAGGPYQSIAVLPLKARAGVLGIIAFSFVTARAFSEPEREFIATLAVQCAQAVERARLHAAERDARGQAEAAQQQLALLAEASAALAGSLGVQETLARVPRLLVPALGDFCILYRLDEQGEILPAASSHADPEREDRLEAWKRVYQPRFEAPDSILSRVLRSGQPEWVAELPPLPARLPPETEPLRQAVLDLGPRSVLIVPLVARGRVLGALALCMAESGRAYREADLAAAQELARRSALALDNALLYETAQRLNLELERKLHARTEQLAASENRFHSLVDSVQDYAIFMLDPGGHVASWNNGAVRIKGYSADEIIGQHFSRFYTPEEAASGKPERGLHRARTEGRHEDEGWRVRQDGTRFWANVVITPVRAEDGSLIGYAKVTRDLSERRRVEEKLRLSERRLAKAESVAHLGSWHWDLLADSMAWSEELYRIYGLPPQSAPLTYAGFLERVHPEDRGRVNALLQRTVDKRRSFAVDHRIVRDDGTVRTVHTAGEVVLDNEGRPTALAGAGQDITERKQIEDELHRSREELRQLAARLEGAREDERARMAREIHDELGGMLTGLKMDVAQLRRGATSQDPRAAERLDVLTGAIDEAIQTVRRIASDLRPAVLDDFGLLAAMEWQLNDFVRRSGLGSTWTSAADGATLPRDNATAVFRVFQESLTNIARHAGATRVDVAVEAHDGWLLLRVADNGRGITPEQTLGAHSLGLAGMRERMAVLGGSVEITGSPGAGTTVVVRAPLAE